MQFVFLSLLLYITALALVSVELLVLLILAIVGLLTGNHSLVEPINRVFRAAIDRDIWDMV